MNTRNCDVSVNLCSVRIQIVYRMYQFIFIFESLNDVHNFYSMFILMIPHHHKHMIAGGGWDLPSAPACMDACVFEISFIITLGEPTQRPQSNAKTQPFTTEPNENKGTVEVRSCRDIIIP